MRFSPWPSFLTKKGWILVPRRKKIGMFELVLKIVLEVTDELSYHSKNESSAFKLPPPQQAKSLQMGALVCVLFIERSRN